MATDSLPGGNRYTVQSQEFTTSADSLEIAKAREARDKEMQGQVINFARDSEVRDAGLGVRVSNALTRAASAGETASAALSASGRAVAETFENRSLLEQYLDSSEDPSAPTGAKSEALERAYRRSVSVAEFGAVGDDVTDDTAAIQAAADAAYAGGATLFFPPGKYLTTGTVTLRGRVHGDEGTIRYHGGGTALVVGSPDAGAPAWRTMYRLPKVEHRTTAWDGTSVGVRIVNANACEIHVPYVREFETGLIFEGRGTGFAYNTILLGTLWCNHVQLWLTADKANGGYCNQNVTLGGRLQLPSSYVAADALDDPSAAQLRLLSTDPTWGPNNNLFLNTSFESDGVPYYLLDCGGVNNFFVNCRWEAFGKPARVRWRSGSQRNVIDGGYDLWKLEAVHDGDKVNTIRDDEGGYAWLSTTAGQSIPNDVRTVLRYWISAGSRLIVNKASEGKIRPKRGRWRVTAQIAFAHSTAGRRMAYLYWQADSSSGPSVLSAAETAAPTEAGACPTVTVTGVRRFDGATDVWVEAYQTSGGKLPLVTSSGMNSFIFEYLGP